MVLLHLRGRKASDYLLRKGKVWKGKFFTVYWLPGPQVVKGAKKASLLGIYLGTFASTKLNKSAVVRNRMRRRVREGFRITIQETKELPAAQLLLTPRSASLEAPFEDILRDVRTFFTVLPPWHPKPRLESGTTSSSSPLSTSAPN